MLSYFRETIQEMKLVIWPSRRHVWMFTIMVIIVSLAVAYYLGLFDWLFSMALEGLVA